MDQTSMNNDRILVENVLIEQHPHGDNQQKDDFTQNQSDPARPKNIIPVAKKGPMNPTPLEFSCWSTYPTATAVGAYVFFASLAITVGVLVVCLCPRKAPSRDSSHPQSVAVGDFNSDGHMDIVVANVGFDNVTIFLGYGNNTFALQVASFTIVGSAPRMAIVADFNRDNRSDIAIAQFGINSIGILFGDGDGHFPSGVAIDTSPSRPLYMAVGDLNNDGCVDIVFTGYGTANLGVLLGFGNGTFSTRLSFSTGYDSLPCSLALGHFNNDNQLDIAVVNSGTDNVGILLGYGNGSFTSQATYTTGAGSRPYSIAIADLDNDTHLDIVAVNSKADNFGVLYGYGNGSFTLPIPSSTDKISNPISIVIADFNKDHTPDITVANNGTDSIALLFGHGNGTFADPIVYSMGPRSSPYSLAVADFNSDGQPDLAAANQQNNNVKIFNSYTNVSFGTQTTFPTSIHPYLPGTSVSSTGIGSSPISLAVGDLNSDGRVDVAVANGGTNNVGVLLGCGDGEFLPQMIYPTGDNSLPIALAIHDFNGDGRLDIAVANFGTNNIGILLGYGNGTFSSPTNYPTGDHSQPRSLSVADFDGDGQADIAVANYGTSNVGVFLGSANGTFSPQTNYFVGDSSGPISLAVGDLNDDNRLDIVVVNSNVGSAGVLLGHGDGTFSSQMVDSIGSDSYPTHVLIADFNNDSRPDIAVAISGTNSVGILLAYGNGSFSSQTNYPTGDSSQTFSLDTGDFDGDGRLDIAVANAGTNNIGILFGYGTGEFAPQMIYLTGSGSHPTDVAVTDFNNDGRPDIALVNYGITNLVVLLGQGNGSFPHIPDDASIFFCPMSVAIGDFNNDSQLDIAVSNSVTDKIGVLLGYGNGSFERQRAYPAGTGSQPMSIVVGDFNSDSRLDIAVANAGTANVGIRFGYGDGNFSSQTNYPTGNNSWPFALAIGDFNGDGRLDIVVANYEMDNVGLLLGYGHSEFLPQNTYSTGKGSNPIAVAVGDFNNDGHLDIAVANCNLWNVGVFLGYGDGHFRNQITFPTGVFSNPRTLAVGDFNEDGNLDIVVGHTQSNEENAFILLGNGNGNFSNGGRYFTAIGQGLCSVVVGHFNNDTQSDFAVANSLSQTIEVFLGSGDGSFSSQTTYPTSDGSFAVSIAAGDFNNDNLTDLVVANYRTYSIGVFLALANTSFVDQGTLSTGSAASPVTIVLGDFTNDGQLDIVVGNDGTHNIWILINDGNGSFSMQPIFVADSTFYPLSLIATDFNNDNRLDLAFAASATDNVTLLFGEGNGAFANHSTYLFETNSKPESIAVGDLNNDKRTDIVVALSGTGSVGVLLKLDTGALDRMRTFSTGTGSKPHGLVVGDFNNDGHLDIAVANNGNAGIGFFFGLGNGAFSDQTSVSLGEGIFPTWLALGDFNNDKQLDVVIANNFGTTSVTVLLGNGDGSFRNQTVPNIGSTYTSAVGDFNDDGQLDIVFCLQSNHTVEVLLGCGDGTFRNRSIYPTGDGSYPPAVVVGDFNNDGRLDIAVALTGLHAIGILLGQGNGTFSSLINNYINSDWFPLSIAVGDFDNDNRLDIAVGSWSEYSVCVLFGDGNGTFANPVNYSFNRLSPQSIYVVDFNNDGRLDIIVTNSDKGSLGILLGHTNGTFFNQIIHSTGDNSYPFSIGVGDFNNDGRLDITVSNMLSDNIGVFLGYASENFASTPVYIMGDASQPVGIAVGDFNHDTNMDAVVADRGTNEIVILHGAGDGTFSGYHNYSTGSDSRPNWVAVADFNQDKQLDIVVVNSGTSEIAVFLGRGDGTFSDSKTYSTGDSSVPLSLAVGHFDNDTHLDIAVANSASGTVYVFHGYDNGSFANPLSYSSGFDSHPSAVAFGDLTGDGLFDIVVCKSGSSSIEILTKICH